MAHQPPCKMQKQGTISSFYRKITAIPTTNVESVNEEMSVVVADTVTAVSSTSLSSFKESKSETLTITDTDQQTVQEKKTHLRMSAFHGLFILMVATYVALVAFMLERLRAVEARWSSIPVS